MIDGGILGLAILVLVVVLALGLLALYNGLVRGRLKTREGWSAVEVQLQRRANLVPNLVETVSGYAAHERGTLESVTRARAQLQTAQGPQAAAEANNMLTQALRSLFAVAEAYPELKANQNFLELQEALADTEDKIAYARNYYNAVVREYNEKVLTVPSAFVAGLFGFREAEFFRAESGSEETPRVAFT